MPHCPLTGHPKYKLTYFGVRFRAETSRFLFAYAKVPYEDIRVGQEWGTLKPNTPFGQLPMLEVDGKVFGQTTAIERYLAKKFKLAGNSDEEQAHVGAIADYVKDITAARHKWWGEKNPETKKTLQDEYFKITLPDQLDILTTHLKLGGGKFFAPSGVTLADFSVATELYTLTAQYPNALDRHPELKEHLERVNNLPGIKEWIATRPKTDN